MKRRIYVAIAIPPDLQERMVAISRKYDLPVRWIAGKNLHITLIPPWYAEDIDEVKEQLRRLEKHRKFYVAFNKVRYGPDSRNPRLIWAEGPTTKKILDLQEHVESALGAHDERSFRLHVTLARFKPEDFLKFSTKVIDEDVDWKFMIDSIVLMESHLSAKGADYEILERIKFKSE